MSKMKSVYGEPKDNYTFKIRLKSTILVIWFVILTIICLLPIYIIVINSTRTTADIIQNGISFIPGTNLFQNIANLNDPTIQNGAYTNSYNVWIGYANSMIIAVCSTVLSVFFSALTAYGLTVYDFKLKKFATTFILAVMMIPTQVVSTGF